MKPLSNLAVRDIETVIHPYTNLAAHREVGPLVLERGEGIYVWDSDGTQYIEGWPACGARRSATATGN